MTSSLRGPDSPLAANHVVTLYNPIQLAAISNYKLAQLTFAPPDINSLRKTAVVKNMLQDIYSSTPAEWLQQMTRWQYFTPESLEEMTQEGLEEIFIQYAQTIEAFRPVKSMNPFDEDNDIDFFGQNDHQSQDLWIAEDIHELPLPPTNIPVYLQEPSEQERNTNSDESVTSSIFSHPNTTISNESVSRPRASFVDKPLPANPILSNDTNQAKRISGFNSNRMSWKSDTGVVSGAVSQNLANELMNLFDMDFEVDIDLNTAPKLPELPFKPKRRSQQRQSHDMLSSLLPEFEKIALQNSASLQNRPNMILKSVPKRSSSLRHRQEFINARIQPSPPPPVPEPSARKRKTILRLASLVTSKKHQKEPFFNYDKKLPASPEVVPIEHHPDTSSLSIMSIPTPRKTSISTNGSIASVSSSWSSVYEITEMEPRLQKPLPAIPQTEKQHKRRSKKRNSFRSLSKRKSLQDTESEISKSKSFIKIGLKKNHIRRTSSSKNLSEQDSNCLYKECTTEQNFVKKMASFNWRMKPRNKPVEA